MPTSEAEALVVDGLEVCYGENAAVAGLSFSVARGETLALLGANGAGKTTLLRAISGQLPVAEGEVKLEGRRITGMRPHRIARLGLLHVPEGRQVVAPLDVSENLKVAALASKRCPPDQLASALGKVFDLFPELADKRGRLSGLLSGGEQQMLAMGRALVAGPRVLLLDEPSMGLAPIVIERVYEFLANPGELLQDTAVVLAEQSSIALTVSDRACILAQGSIVFAGKASEVSRDIAVEAYLGTAASEHPSDAR